MAADRSVKTGTPHPQGLGEDPLLYFTRVYLTFLQGLFSQFPSGCYRWSDNSEDSEITITDQAPIPIEIIEQRPAIVTMRGQAQFANLSLDQLRSVDHKTGEREHTDLAACTMTLNCLASEGLEAQRVAWIVARHIRTFKRLLQRNGHIHQVGEQVSVAPETPVGSLVSPEPDPEMVNVSVFSPFFFQWTERVTPTNAPLVQNIEAHMQARLYPPLDEPGAETTRRWEKDIKAKQPTIRGVPVKGTSTPISNPIDHTVKS